MATVRRNRTGWEVRWTTPERQSRKKIFPRQAEANRFAASIETAKAGGHYVDPSSGRLLFAEWAERWLATTVALRPSTRERDEGYLRRYVLPRFESLQLAQIDHTMVVEWVAELTSRGLSPATVVLAYQTLSKVMASAVRSRRIPVSPCQGVKLPRIERTEMRFLTIDEIATLAESMDPRYSAAVLLGAFGGLRAGELFGLRAGRVDPLHKRVEVAEIVVEVGGRVLYGPPKTRSSHRVVPIPDVVAEALANHLAGDGPAALVFPAPEGGPVRLASWRRRFWQPAVERAGLAPLRVHDLRHTAVSLWLAAGADPVEVARRAGHTSVSFVLDRYGHVQPRVSDLVTAKLDEMARGARPPAPIPLRSASGSGD